MINSKNFFFSGLSSERSLVLSPSTPAHVPSFGSWCITDSQFVQPPVRWPSVERRNGPQSAQMQTILVGHLTAYSELCHSSKSGKA